jgi:hypothetical protein
MSYTVLRITNASVVLWDYHVRRLGLGQDSVAYQSLVRFVRAATPGVWAIGLDGQRGLQVEARSGSRLYDGMPARLTMSPVAGNVGYRSKTKSPGPYDGVRQHGVATLLTDASGTELYEACSAAIVAWDGQRIVCVARECPRVWSTAENAIRDHLPVGEATIPVGSDAILLVNAVKGICELEAPHSQAFPARVRRDIDQLFAHVTIRP